ncbi:MAG: AAA family ATPase, partial [Vicinamibacterales bacterium]|nr:AAA family ATPase [Vicinamibacterales bacterium]
MRLNRLEISGFKSFPDRADLAFDRGVTAIVGPNGCGKSNVVDAITWVLGEQSAKTLRGERMEDVIFGGSDVRKPTAAAEVRLKLADVPSQAARVAAVRLDPALGDGTADAGGVQMALPATDLRDVEIARRLYRSGESEYLIDGDVVRLRDVQDLLMDGGIGVRGYAVIEQGKIGQILSAKPTDRRLLIEEAAGVTKYKTRRRAAELKLEAAQQNLSRVDDVIFEIEKQRTSLRRQAAKARRYRALREELRRWEKVLFARRYRALAQTIEAARARLAEAREREAQLVADLAARERDLDATRADLGAAEAKATAAREAAHGRQLEAERRQQQLAFDRQQVETLAGTIESLVVELAALESRRAPAQAELDQRRAAAAEAETFRQQAAERLAAQQEALTDAQRRVQSAEHSVEDARRQVAANATTLATLHNVIERAREAADRLAGEMTRLDAEASDLRIEVERVTAEREQFAETLRGAHLAVEQARTARAAREASLAGARVEREQRRADLRSREREVAALDARLRSLEELEAAREGYGDAARAILADARIGIAHAGAVADAVEAEPAYERAVEACLGDLLQFVLVPSHEEARRGLDVVRARNLGRCGFLVTS